MHHQPVRELHPGPARQHAGQRSQHAGRFDLFKEFDRINKSLDRHSVTRERYSLLTKLDNMFVNRVKTQVDSISTRHLLVYAEIVNIVVNI